MTSRCRPARHTTDDPIGDGCAVAYLWTYQVRPEHAAAFRTAYGDDGEWARFFRRCEAYLGSELLEGAGTSGRFLSIDYFVDMRSHQRFIEAYRDEYDLLDRRWAIATTEETFIGAFLCRAAHTRSRAAV